jgi:hypothetical protein
MKRENPDEFATEKGIVLHLLPINVMEYTLAMAGIREEYEEKNKPIDPPTYEVILAGGVKEYYPHDATTLEVKGNPEQTVANQKAWADHMAALVDMTLEQSDIATQIALEDGVSEEPPDSEWEKHAKERRIKIPTIPKKRKAVWLQLEVLASQFERRRLVNKILIYSTSQGVGRKKEVEAALEPFRNSVSSDGNAIDKTEVPKEGQVET